jgi:cobalt/nickel transport system permease protein
MNRAEQALYELKQTDELAAMDSPVHRFSALSKLLVTLVYLITVMSFHKYDLPGVLMMCLYPYAVFQLSGLSFRMCLHKMRWVIPLVAFIGVFNPFLDRQTVVTIGSVPLSGGIISFLNLLIKGILCLSASFLLVSTTRIDDLCGAMRKLHIPSLLVTVFMLTFRYISVLTEEAAVMSDAYHLRAPGQKGIAFEAWGSFLGQLLLRSMDRAKELYAAMLLRGYNGEFPETGRNQNSKASLLWLAVWLLAFLTLRTVNIPMLIGGLFVR